MLHSIIQSLNCKFNVTENRKFLGCRISSYCRMLKRKISFYCQEHVPIRAYMLPSSSFRLLDTCTSKKRLKIIAFEWIFCAFFSLSLFLSITVSLFLLYDMNANHQIYRMMGKTASIENEMKFLSLSCECVEMRNECREQ